MKCDHEPQLRLAYPNMHFIVRYSCTPVVAGGDLWSAVRIGNEWSASEEMRVSDDSQERLYSGVNTRLRYIAVRSRSRCGERQFSDSPRAAEAAGRQLWF